MSTKGVLLSTLFVLSLASAVTTVSAQIQFDSLSAEETAKELANPTNPLGRVTIQFKRWAFKGNREKASGTSGHSLEFESSIPLVVGNGGVIRFRPTVPVYLDYLLSLRTRRKSTTDPGWPTSTLTLPMERNIAPAYSLPLASQRRFRPQPMTGLAITASLWGRSYSSRSSQSGA